MKECPCRVVNCPAMNDLRACIKIKECPAKVKELEDLLEEEKNKKLSELKKDMEYE